MVIPVPSSEAKVVCVLRCSWLILGMLATAPEAMPFCIDREESDALTAIRRTGGVTTIVLRGIEEDEEVLALEDCNSCEN